MAFHSIGPNSTQGRIFKSEPDCGRVLGTIKGENHNREIRQLLSTRDTRKIWLLDCSGTINNDILMGLIDCLVPSSLCGFDMT